MNANDSQASDRDETARVWPETTTLTSAFDDGVLRLTLDRPAVKNAINQTMIRELNAVLDAVANHRDGGRDVRAVVLRGRGGVFSAGGDVREMKASLNAPEEERHPRVRAYSLAFGRLLRRIDALPQVVVAAVEGPALGGAMGLVAVADVVVATESARFALPETSLGLVPAQIAPFLARRLSLAAVRHLALTSERCYAREANVVGLVHHVVADATALDERLEKLLDGILRCAPGAVASTKALLGECAEPVSEALLGRAADLFAETILGEEAAEGTRAMLGKRPPAWARGS